MGLKNTTSRDYDLPETLTFVTCMDAYAPYCYIEGCKYRSASHAFRQLTETPKEMTSARLDVIEAELGIEPSVANPLGLKLSGSVFDLEDRLQRLERRVTAIEKFARGE